MSRDAAGKAVAAWCNPDALPHAYFYARALFPPGQLERLIEPRFRPSTVGADGVTLEPTWLGWLDRTASEAAKFEPVGATSWMEMRCYMASTLLRDTDSVSMARSLEVRVPLLDTPLVEFVSYLPDAARHRAGVQKALLVEALAGLLPEEILAQRKKTFTLPWEEWLRGALRPRLEASFAEICAIACAAPSPRKACAGFGARFSEARLRGRARGRFTSSTSGASTTSRHEARA